MRNLPPRRRAAVLAASCAAIAPSVILLSKNNGDPTAHTATFLGMAAGILVGVSILLVRNYRNAC